MLDALGTALQQVVLAEHLHSDNLLRASVPRHHHTPELALAEDTAEGKVLDAGLPRFVRHLQAGPFPSRPVLGVVLERTWSGTQVVPKSKARKVARFASRSYLLRAHLVIDLQVQKTMSKYVAPREVCTCLLNW